MSRNNVRKGMSKMKKVVCVLLVLGLCVFCVPPHCVMAAELSAEAAVLMEFSTGRVLYEKNADAQRSMASTTKIMTALLALESDQVYEEITISADMLKTEGSSVYLQQGDRLTLHSLVVGLMLESGNDAALAIAIALDGSEEAFSARMNRRAAQLGMTSTHFVTASGLDDEGHYTTARDMAVLACAAMQNPQFESIVSQQSMTVDISGENARRRTFHNHNRLLREADGCIGIKTGFTKKSGRCLVTCFERNGIRLVAVTLRAPDDWNDHKRLMQSGFTQVENITLSTATQHVTVPVVGAGAQSTTLLRTVGTANAVIPIGSANQIQMKIETEPFLYAPVVPERVAGRVSYWLNGEEIADIALITTEEVAFVPRKRNAWERFWLRIKQMFGFTE